MFSLDLKNLLQLSQSKKGTGVVSHKRITCGKVSYNICYALKNGYLIVQQAKRIKMVERKSTCIRRHLRRRRQLMHLSQTSSVPIRSRCHAGISSFKSATVVNVGSQSEHLEQRQVAVDTTDLFLKISRYQQCMAVSLNTSGSQTKQINVEPRSTQMEHIIKTKMTQTCGNSSSVSSTQTVAAVVRDSWAQTTLSEDEQELLEPHTKLMNCLLHSIRIQMQLLGDGIEAINYLLSIKELELQKEKLLHVQELKSIKIKLVTIQKACKRCKHCCKHGLLWHRNCKGKSKPKLAINQTQMEALATPTNCVCKQQRKFESKFTQTDKSKGFSFLRRN